MSETPAPRASTQNELTELSGSFRLLEGRFSTDELAERVVRAALAQPGVGGARLWRMERGTAEVWAEAGALPRGTSASASALPSAGTDPSLWTTPLGSDDFRLRVLEVHGPAPLAESTRAQLELLARFAAVVLALAERRGAMEELSSIIEATKRLNSTLDLGELIHIILQIATRQSGAKRGTVFLLDRARNEIWSLVGLGLEQHVIRLPADRGIAGWVARQGTAVRLENAYQDPRFEPEIDRRLGFKTDRLLCLPIRSENGTIVGVLQLLNKPEPFTEEDEKFLDALSAHVALALEKAQFHRERLEKEKLERDLALAREIQAGLLPEQPPQWAGIEIAVSHRPSLMVGGDYYDFVPVRGDALLTVVADVEGKGAASALVMANVQAMLRALADGLDKLEDVPATINRKMLERARASKYVSMFLALVEEGGRRLRYVNAGHVPPVIVRADGGCESLEEGGMIVGLLPEAVFASAEVALAPGDILVACTDGITEATDTRGNEYGREQLMESVAARRNSSAREILASVVHEVEAFSRGGIHEDDRVLLILKVK